MGMLVENMGDTLVREALKYWGITDLTDIQERALQAGLLTEKSLIVSAPRWILLISSLYPDNLSQSCEPSVSSPGIGLSYFLVQTTSIGR
jgi:hypothetical protein